MSQTIHDIQKYFREEAANSNPIHFGHRSDGPKNCLDNGDSLSDY
jgi:hypothetical protein